MPWIPFVLYFCAVHVTINTAMYCRLSLVFPSIPVWILRRPGRSRLYVRVGVTSNANIKKVPNLLSNIFLLTKLTCFAQWAEHVSYLCLCYPIPYYPSIMYKAWPGLWSAVYNLCTYDWSAFFLPAKPFKIVLRNTQKSFLNILASPYPFK